MTKSVTSIMQGARQIYAADVGTLICAVLIIVSLPFSTVLGLSRAPS